MYLLDSNIVSEPMKMVSNRDVCCLIDIRRAECAVSTITLYEILYGILRMPEGKRKRDYWQHFNSIILKDFHIIPYNKDIAIYHATFAAKLVNLGKTPPTNDSMIAATALAHNMTLVTRNVKDFSNIAEITDLKIENWFLE